jgi:hypothetical protein
VAKSARPSDQRGTDAEYRKLLEQCETEATSEFDKTTVTLSGGALGIALAFLKDIAPTAPKWAVLCLLAPALLGLVGSLLGVLLSLMSSMKSMRYELQCLNGLRTKPEGEHAGGHWRTFTNAFNWTALAGCMVGIALLSAFLIVALWKGSAMPKDDSQGAPKTTTRDIREGEQRGRLTPDRPSIAPASSETSGGGAGKEGGGKGKD